MNEGLFFTDTCGNHLCVKVFSTQRGYKIPELAAVPVDDTYPAEASTTTTVAATALELAPFEAIPPETEGRSPVLLTPMRAPAPPLIFSALPPLL